MRLITDPDRFFEDLKNRDINLKRPLAVVSALSILVSAYQYLLMSKLAQAIPEDLATFFVAGAYIGIIGSFTGMFAVWVIMAIVMHGLSAFFGGKGSFRRTFEFIGYGFLPSLVGSLITVPVSAYYLMNAEIPKIDLAQLQNPDAVGDIILSFIPRDVVYSNLIINLAVTVWGLVIWTFAVKHARGVELRKAFICALIPTVLFGIYQIWNLTKLL
ncbi:Yip1 family protein [Geoglobus acetivorans]|uniref:Yip1 domain-containing protein n=1 Tax=Geoglobus acetivorans TaxID=565033 RepID=A0A0A7GG45_GEOAI|nr:hypothetical protein GACE_2031 [Geoglobus acetivorans]